MSFFHRPFNTLSLANGFTGDVSPDEVVLLEGSITDGVTMHMENGDKAFAPSPISLLRFFGEFPETAIPAVFKLDPFIGYELAAFVNPDVAVSRSMMTANKVSVQDDTTFLTNKIPEGSTKKDTTMYEAAINGRIQERAQEWPVRIPIHYVYDLLAHRDMVNTKAYNLEAYLTAAILNGEVNPLIYNAHVTSGIPPKSIERGGIIVSISDGLLEVSDVQRNLMRLSPYEVMLLHGGMERFEAYVHAVTVKALFGVAHERENAKQLNKVLTYAKKAVKDLAKIESNGLHMAWEQEVGKKIAMPSNTDDARDKIRLQRAPHMTVRIGGKVSEEAEVQKAKSIMEDVSDDVPMTEEQKAMEMMKEDGI